MYSAQKNDEQSNSKQLTRTYAVLVLTDYFACDHNCSPLNLLSRLRHEESDHVGRYLVLSGVNRDLGISSLPLLGLNREKEKLQLDKTQSVTRSIEFLISYLTTS